MNAYELCQRHVVTIRRHEELSTAAWIMRERHVGCLVVVDPAGPGGGWHPVGLLSDRDIVTQVIARERDPRHVMVEEAMTRQPATVSTHSSVEAALRVMRAAHVRRVPLVDDRGRLSGILALDDILEYMAQRIAPAVSPMHPDRRIDQSARQP